MASYLIDGPARQKAFISIRQNQQPGLWNSKAGWWHLGWFWWYICTMCVVLHQRLTCVMVFRRTARYDSCRWTGFLYDLVGIHETFFRIPYDSTGFNEFSTDVLWFQRVSCSDVIEFHNICISNSMRVWVLLRRRHGYIRFCMLPWYWNVFGQDLKE